MLLLLNYAIPFASRLRRQEGQTMAEYAVVLAVITIAVVATFVLLGTEIKGVIEDVTGRIDGSEPAPATP